MRRPRALRSWPGWLACSALLLITSCDDDASGPPNEHAVVFLHVSLSDTVPALRPWNLRAFSYLGSNLCWQLQSAGIERTDSKLVAWGRSRFESPPSGACPEALAQEWVEIVGPALPAGDYAIEAGIFRDTLVVRGRADPFGTRIMARGQLWRSGEVWRFTSEAYEQYQISNQDMVPRAGMVRLYGFIVGREADFVVIRRIEYESPGKNP